MTADNENSMTPAQFATETDRLGMTAPALAKLLDRKPGTISHYRTDVTPPPEVVKKLRRLQALLDDFRKNG